MKFFLIASTLLSLACHAHAKSKSDLSIYGIIGDVKLVNGEVSIVFTGVGHLMLNDPSLKDPLQSFSLSNAVIYLKFDNEFKGMHTYSGFRYIDWITDQQAIAILNECQKQAIEVRMNLDVGALTYSKKEGGPLQVSSLTGTLDEVAKWTHIEKESISEYTKSFGVRYDLVPGVKRQAEQAAPSDGDKPAN
jgi:hypothetical protein